MTRTMYDAVTWQNIPESAEMVAGYGNGGYTWSPEAWARFPHAVKVRITITASAHSTPGNRLHVLDVENGDATPAEAPGWCEEERRLGEDPSVYCNASTWPAVRAAFAAARVAGPHWWIADYDGIAQIPAGAVAKQYQTNGVDVSVVADYWPGVDPAPKPKPKPKPAKPTQPEEPMLLNKGKDAITPIALPANCARVRFFASQAAVVDVDLRDGKPMTQIPLGYQATMGVDVPHGCDGIVVHRVDAGSNDVSCVPLVA